MMFKKILENISGVPQSKKPAKRDMTRRIHDRRKSDPCVVSIAGKLYPVVDWSIGGVQISCDPRNFSLEQEANVILKFRSNKNPMEIEQVEFSQTASVVRKASQKIALKFLSVEPATKTKMRRLIADYTHDKAMNSQFA